MRPGARVRASILVALFTLSAPPVHAAGGGKGTVARCTDAAVEGQQLRAKGSLRKASERFAVCTAPECPGIVRRDCGKWLGEVEEALPSLVFRVLDARGDDVREGQIFFDGEVLAAGMEGRAVSVDPGEHRFAYVNGQEYIEQDVVVREGERNRHLLFRIPDKGGAAKSASAPAPALADTPDPVPAARASQSPWPWILGGAGLVSLGVGGGFWYAGNNAHGDLGDTCAPTHSCADADVSRAKTQLLVGDILVGVGAVAITSAIVWLVTRPSPKAEVRSAQIR